MRISFTLSYDSISKYVNTKMHSIFNKKRTLKTKCILYFFSICATFFAKITDLFLAVLKFLLFYSYYDPL